MEYGNSDDNMTSAYAAQMQDLANGSNSINSNSVFQAMELKRPENCKNYTVEKSHDDSVQKSTDHDFLGITAAEAIGKRQNQQDAMSVVCVSDSNVMKEAVRMFERTVAAIVKRHHNATGGTTLCSAFVSGSEVVVCNLGDSRAVLTIRHKNGEYETISLSEDHNLCSATQKIGCSDECLDKVEKVDNQSITRQYYITRVGEHVRESGGRIEVWDDFRVNGSLNMGAAVGDGGLVGDSGLSCLLYNPDIWKFELNDFLKDGESLKDVSIDVIVACDGLFNLMHSDAEFCSRRNGYHGHAKFGPIHKSPVLPTGPEERMISVFKRMFDEGYVVREGGSRSRYKNFAEALRDMAINLYSDLFDDKTGDNVSVANIPVIVDGKRQIKDGKAVLATVCDGHEETGEEVSAKSCDMLLRSFKGTVIAGLDVDAGIKPALLKMDDRVGGEIYSSNKIKRYGDVECGSERPGAASDVDDNVSSKAGNRLISLKRPGYCDDSVREAAGYGFLGITAADTVGKEDKQQNSSVVADVSDSDVMKNSVKMFVEAADILNGCHGDYTGGTTLCSAFVSGSEVVVCNLGDSRAVLTIRHKDGEYETISLSEDHKLYDERPGSNSNSKRLTRVGKHIRRRGGYLAIHSQKFEVRNDMQPFEYQFYKVNDLDTGAAIGDMMMVSDGGESYLLRNPDIWQFDLKSFLKDGESLDDVSMDVVVACKGLFDVMQSDRGFYCEVNGYHGSANNYYNIIQDQQLSAEYSPFLDNGKERISEFKKMFDEGYVVREGGSRSRYKNFAEALRDVAVDYLSSATNVSVVNIPVIVDGKRQVGDGRAILAAVCDGHGNGGEVVSESSCGILRSKFKGFEIAGLRKENRELKQEKPKAQNNMSEQFVNTNDTDCHRSAFVHCNDDDMNDLLNGLSFTPSF